MVDAIVGDVIQLDPAHCDWGPLLCIVDEVRSNGRGVRCYNVYPEERGKLASAMYLHVKHGHYVVIGRAEWAIGTEGNETPPDFDRIGDGNG